LDACFVVTTVPGQKLLPLAEGKAIAAYRRRLCCLSRRSTQYPISKTKLSIRMTAVTPAMESTKAFVSRFVMTYKPLGLHGQGPIKN
jgi:hypothetical protein